MPETDKRRITGFRPVRHQLHHKAIVTKSRHTSQCGDCSPIRRLQNLLEMSGAPTARRPHGVRVHNWSKSLKFRRTPTIQSRSCTATYSSRATKLWFYLSDVRRESGPLAFVKRSHWLTPQRLYHIYKESCIRAPGANPSRRVTPRREKKDRR